MKENYVQIIEKLKESYPDAKCSLNFTTPFELLIAVVLSAQCTDERVNKVTPSIFKKYNTPKDFVEIEMQELERLIHSCGFYKNKSKNIKLCSQKILDDYNGQVPQNMDELISLPRCWKKKCKCYYVRSI